MLFKYSHIKLPKRVVFFGWFASISIILIEIFSTLSWNRGETSPSMFVSILYAGSFRVFWALAVAWIVIACHNGYGGLAIIDFELRLTNQTNKNRVIGQTVCKILDLLRDLRHQSLYYNSNIHLISNQIIYSFIYVIAILFECLP